METLSKVGRYEFLAEPFHCDFSNRLFMGHLGNHLLNAADFHSTDRGFGMRYLLSVNRAWVLSRLAIEMIEMPEMYTRFAVETWVEGAMKYFTHRNFAITGVPSAANPQLSTVNSQLSPQKIYGYGRSVWAMIDTQSRQPTDILAMNDGAIKQWIETEKPCPIDKEGRVKMSDEAQLVRTIDTYYNDVDINGHINSVKYIEHVLDLFDMDWYQKYWLKRFEIAYVAESHCGDLLHFYMEKGTEEVETAGGKQEFYIRVTKTSPSNTHHPTPDTPIETEVARSKVQFIHL